MKTILIYLIISICLFFSASCGKERSKTITNKDIHFKYSWSIERMSRFNFDSKRHFINDSVFIDYGLLGSCDTCKSCSLKFYIKDDNWFIWNGKKWKSFYDVRKKKLNEVELFYTNKKIEPGFRYKNNNDTLFSFSSNEKNVNYSSDYTKYFFIPTKGIVLISNEKDFAMRNDYNGSNFEKKTQLTN